VWGSTSLGIDLDWGNEIQNLYEGYLIGVIEKLKHGWRLAPMITITYRDALKQRFKGSRHPPECGRCLAHFCF
jgi:hypothetical protein